MTEEELNKYKSEVRLEAKRCEILLDEFMEKVYPHHKYVNALSLKWVVKFAVFCKFWEEESNNELLQPFILNDSEFVQDLSHTLMHLNAIVRPYMQKGCDEAEMEFLVGVLSNRLREIHDEYKCELKSKKS